VKSVRLTRIVDDRGLHYLPSTLTGSQ
jgi:hypothetical protein